MKFLIITISLFFSTSLLAINHKQFLKLSNSQKEKFLFHHLQFFKELTLSTEISQLDYSPKKHFSFLLALAYAEENYNCFYAGWPSKTVASGSRQLCSNPVRHNPHYLQSSTACSENQLKCQPLLFGDGLCAEAATSTQKNLAYSQCEEKFRSQNRTLKDVIDEMSGPENGQMFNELFALVDEVCYSGIQASKPMCRNLKNRVALIKDELLLNPERQPAGNDLSLVAVVEEVIDIDQMVNNTLSQMGDCLPLANSLRNRPPFRPDVIEPQIEIAFNQNSYPRIMREVNARCGGSSSAEGHYALTVFNCTAPDDTRIDYPAGFGFRSRANHPYANVTSLYEDGAPPYRQIEMESPNHAFNETYLYLQDSAGGPDSHNVKSIMFIIPRRTVPSVQVKGQVVEMTLPTGEKVEFDKATNAILGGALREGAMDLTTDRFRRTPPNIHYQGSGISIRLDHRFEHPTTSSEVAIVKQGNKTCRVPRARLFNSKGDLISQSDQEFLTAINRSCSGSQGGFSL
jgi:hypothetical protein